MIFPCGVHFALVSCGLSFADRLPQGKRAVYGRGLCSRDDPGAGLGRQFVFDAQWRFRIRSGGELLAKRLVIFPISCRISLATALRVHFERRMVVTMNNLAESHLTPSTSVNTTASNPSNSLSCLFILLV